jgi:hypothetical protein
MAQEISQMMDSESSSLRKIEKDTSFSLGQYGATYLEAGTSTSGSFGAIQALEVAVLNLSSNNWTATATTAVPVPAGVTIFGNFSSVGVTSGKVLAYRNA